VPADTVFDNAVIICVSQSSTVPAVGDDLKLPSTPK